MLALTADELAPTDTTDEAIAAIVGSGVREILVLGRRGPVQAAFTNPELVELTELAGADLIVDPADLELDPASEAALAGDAMAQRNLAVLREVAAAEPAGRPRAIRLRFLTSPVAILGDERVEAVEVVRNELVDDGRGGLRAVPDRRARGDPVRRRPAQRRLSRRRRSRACRSTSERGVIPNDGGRVARRGRAPDPRRLLHRLDQARAERRDRHQQEGRHRDRRAPARGRARGPADQGRRLRRRRRRAPRRARRRGRHAGGVAGDRRGRALGGRAAAAVRASSSPPGSGSCPLRAAETDTGHLPRGRREVHHRDSAS